MSEAGKYSVIVIDPPWSYGRDIGRMRTAEHHYQTIGATEHVLFATKGNKGIPSALRKPNVVLARPTGHSAKPLAFYDLLRSIYGADERMLDAYARTAHERFDSWGFEAPGETKCAA